MITLKPGVFIYNEQHNLEPAGINFNRGTGDAMFKVSAVANGNLGIKVNGQNITDNVQNSLCIIILSHKYLKDNIKSSSEPSNFIDFFSQARIDQSREWVNENLEGDEMKPLFPVIIITDFNLLNYLPNNDEKEGRMFHREFVNYKLAIDKRINFLDGSVWHRMTSVEAIINTDGESLKEIICYYLRIYNLNHDFFNIPSTIEYLDLSSRMQKENYLMRTKDGGHSTFVTPFISHSETRLHHNINKILLDENKYNSILHTLNPEKKNESLQWRLLIVDDKYKEDPAKKDLAKERIISQWLNEIGTCENGTFGVDENTTLFSMERKNGEKVGYIYRKNISFVQDSKETIEDVVYHVLRKGSQDIIMLDYLLGKDFEKTERRDYGQRLIKLISDILKRKSNREDKDWQKKISESYGLFDFRKNRALEDLKTRELKSLEQDDTRGATLNKEIQLLKKRISQITLILKNSNPFFKLNKAPFDRFWIFPISVHNTALLETLKAEGIQFNNPNWYISRGGDPVNTPYLFLYNLLKLMEFQISEAQLDRNELEAHLSEFIADVDGDDDWSGIENKARVAVNRFMYRFGTFEMLESDAKKGSLLAGSLKDLKDFNDPNDIFLYNTIRNFLYLLGYRSYSNLLELLNAAETINTALGRSKKKNREGSTLKDADMSKLLGIIRKQYGR